MDLSHRSNGRVGDPNLTGLPFLSVPLQATKAIIGVLALRLKDPESELWLLPEQLRLHLLESLTKQVALALEVERLEKTAEMQLTAETGHSLLSPFTPQENSAPGHGRFGVVYGDIGTSS